MRGALSGVQGHGKKVARVGAPKIPPLAFWSRLKRLVLAALLAALFGSFVSGLILSLVGTFVAPGDAGMATALMFLPIYILLICLVAFVWSLPLLLFFAVPATWAFVGAILQRRAFASVTAAFIGLLMGLAIGQYIDAPNPDSVFTSAVSGTTFGFAWIFAIILIEFLADKPSAGDGGLI